MSANFKLNKVLYGVMKDNRLRNPDIYKIHNSVRPTKQFYVEKARWWFRKLGYEDFHVFLFLCFPAALIALYQASAFYFVYGEKHMYTNDRLYGLISLPKRPWEKFKDPENTMKKVAYKHNRENPNF